MFFYNTLFSFLNIKVKSHINYNEQDIRSDNNVLRTFADKDAYHMITGILKS